MKRRTFMKGAAAGLLVPAAAQAGLRPRQRRSKYHGGGSAGAGGWSDPTGLTWDYAWDFSAADPDATPDVPALVGGVTLSNTVDNVARGSYPATMLPSGLDLDAGNLGPLDLSTANSAWSCTLPTFAGSVHLRAIVETGASNNGSWTIGDATGQALRLQFANSGSLSRVFVRTYHGGGVKVQEIFDIPHGPVVVDVVLYNNGGSETHRGEIYVNGRVDQSWSADVFSQVTDGDFTIASTTLESLLFAGIRIGDAGTAPLTQAQHDACCNAVLSGVLIDGRTYDHAWDFTAASGSTLDDMVGAEDLSLQDSDPFTVSTTVAMAAAAVGATRRTKALQRTSGSGVMYAAGGGGGMAYGSGDRCWYRIITRVCASGGSTYVINGTSTLAGRDLITITNNQGRSQTLLYPGPSNLQISPAPTLDIFAGAECLIDLYQDGSGNWTVYQTSKDDAETGSVSITPRAIDGTTFNVANLVNSDEAIVFIGYAENANADALTAALHNHDAGLLFAGQ